jgi:hypothetical protein
MALPPSSVDWVGSMLTKSAMAAELSVHPLVVGAAEVAMKRC